MKNKNSYLSAIVYSLLVFGIYSSSIQWLIFHDWKRDDYSYGILIPFIVLYLIWEKRQQISGIVSKPSWMGSLFLILSLSLFWLGELGGEFFITYFSLWLSIASLCLIYFGWDKLKVFLFPLLFSLSMFPLPAFLNNRITIYLKVVSSKLGVMMMQFYGMSAFREGNIIDLGFTQLQVVDACSGLRYLFPMIVLSILIAYYYRSYLWKRLIIVLSSIPLTIISNSLRIALTGILSEKFGSKAVEGFFHDFEGILIFMLTLGVLLLEIWVLRKIFPEPEILEKSAHEETEVIPATGKIISFLRTPQFIVSVLLLGGTLGFSQGIEFREAVPMNQAFSEFPMKIGEWVGHRQILEAKFIEELDFTDYVMAEYTNESKKPVSFYVAYYASQRKGESIHSPASCLRGGGWQFKEAGGSELTLKDNTFLPFNRAIIEKKPVKQISYYWFPSRDRVLTNIYQLKWFNFWDALTRQRTDGALVRVITLVYPDEDVNAAEMRIKEFIRDINPTLTNFLPQ